MTIVSKGYEGTVNYADWAVLANHLGAQYSVFTPEGFKASVGPGDRVIRLQPGQAAGPGIYDVSDAVESVTGAPVGSGNRWDLVALRRDWAAKTSTPVIITGSASKALPGIGVTSTTRRHVPGSLDDQPIALVRFAAGQTAAQEIVDLRCWHGDGGLFGGDRLVLEYLDRVGSVIRIAGEEWQRNLNSVGTAIWEQRGGPVTSRQVGSSIVGIEFPSAPVSGSLIVKAGMIHNGTTVQYGNEYMSAIGFETPFPNACLSVQITEIHQGSAVAHGKPAIDDLSESQFRVLYPGAGGSPVPTERAFLWMAVGY